MHAAYKYLFISSAYQVFALGQASSHDKLLAAHMLKSVTAAVCMSRVSPLGGFPNTHDKITTLAASGAAGHLSDVHVHTQRPSLLVSGNPLM